METQEPEENHASLYELQELIGYRFNDRELLLRALTHSSYANEREEENIRDNERLEFLGDAVLGLAICDWLFRSSGESEGVMTRAKSHLVSARNVRLCARRYRLGRFLRLGRGEEKDGGRLKDSLLVDAFEALIGAVYLDGGMEAARRFIREAFEDSFEEVDDVRLLREDHKSYLQEWVQHRNLPAPCYTVVRTSGPEHSKRFTVELQVGGKTLTRGRGKTKKGAEQDAARAALELLEKGKLDLGSAGEPTKHEGK